MAFDDAWLDQLGPSDWSMLDAPQPHHPPPPAAASPDLPPSAPVPPPAWPSPEPEKPRARRPLPQQPEPPAPAPAASAPVPPPARPTQKLEEPRRPRVVLHLFSGPDDRPNSLGEYFEVEAELRSRELGRVFCEEVDVLVDAINCNLLNNRVFEKLKHRCQLGTFAAVVAGIPCNTYCVARFKKDGEARPLRDRAHKLGMPRESLSKSELKQLAEGNALTHRAIELCAAVWEAGGEVIIENPIDYGDERTLERLSSTPPSSEGLAREQCERHCPLWSIPWVGSFMRFTDAEFVTFDQCTLGSPYRKPTTLAVTPGLYDAIRYDFGGRRCCCRGKHAKRTIGRDGFEYRSAAAAAYPPAMNALLAKALAGLTARRLPPQPYDRSLGILRTGPLSAEDLAARRSADDMYRTLFYNDLRSDEAERCCDPDTEGYISRRRRRDADAPPAPSTKRPAPGAENRPNAKLAATAAAQSCRTVDFMLMLHRGPAPARPAERQYDGPDDVEPAELAVRAPAAAPPPACAAAVESRDEAVERRMRVELGIPDDTDESLRALEQHGICRNRVRDLARTLGFAVLGPRSGLSDADRLLRAIRVKRLETLSGGDSGAVRALV